jgi:hypothetical protein
MGLAIPSKKSSIAEAPPQHDSNSQWTIIIRTTGIGTCYNRKRQKKGVD